MADIYMNQAVTLVYTDDDDRDMAALSLRVDYWIPGNETNIPDGTINPLQVVAVDSVVTITIEKDFLTVASNIDSDWRFHIIDNVSEIVWSVMCFPVLSRGSSCH